ncbi:hypothetical protein [Streptomyces sp. NPDC002790]|uniref:hypothetical protein n=1 Tax=unclassified Streptomyces TaxID=2593676 RepID=UPI0033223E65
MTGQETARVGAGRWRLLLDVAREDGWRRALDELHADAATDALVVGPAGHALLPVTAHRKAARVRLGGVVRDRAAGTETVRDTRVPQVVMVRVDGVAPDRGVDDAGPTGDEEWAVGLAGLRLGLSYALLDAALAHLGGRQSGDTAVLHQQLVKGMVADVVVEHLEIRAVLDAAGADGLAWPAVADVHRRITGADRLLLRLFGASGYVEDGPGRTAYVSELLADAYVGPADWGVPA